LPRIFVHFIISEVWGYENLKILEQIHLKFCKRILRVRNTTPNCIVYGELGRFPLEILVKLRMISYWCKLVNNETQLSSSLYRLMLCLKNQGKNNFKWINYVESILNRAGLGYIFINQVGYCDKTYLNRKFDALNFVIQILVFSFNLTK
jgi:hypothetical protein